MTDLERCSVANRRLVRKGQVGSIPTVSAIKLCTLCKQDKPTDCFDKQPGGKFGVHSRCKPCRSQENKDRLKDPKVRKEMNARRNQSVSAAREFVARYLIGKKCSCGYGDPRALEFDHLDPATKTKSISEMVSEGSAVETILKEIAKCRILCANCHRIHTIQQMGYFDRTSVCPS